MGCELFALGLAWRTALMGGLMLLAAELALRTHYYASAVVVALAALLAFSELVRHLRRIDRVLEQFLDNLSDGQTMRPRRPWLAKLAAAIERTGSAIAKRELALHREIDHWRALADTAPVALFVVEAGLDPRPANRAAFELVRAGAEIGSTAETLAKRPAGSSIIVEALAGRRMVAASGVWSDGTNRWQLVALHAADPTMDLVEVTARHRLVRILAHEIMNSLTPIATLADSVRPAVETIESDDIKAAVEAIARRSRGLMDFVDRFRAVAALPVPHCQRLSLAELFSRVEQLLHATLQQRQVALSAQPDDLTVEADPELLEQALINLLLNSIDAGAHQLVLSAERDADWLRIRVADNGSGFGAEARDSAFIPFFTTKPNGSGIGLTLVQQTMLAHHGTVEIEPGAQGGTIVTLSLPASS
jgi:two-component system nitrogen regulation sensor histidine kinase NtrY